MKTYEITLKHEGEDVTARTQADNITTAKESVCADYGVPVSAVHYWRVVPTKKQIARTKSLMRGI